jgi:Nuclease A inhibitor-like protein
MHSHAVRRAARPRPRRAVIPALVAALVASTLLAACAAPEHVAAPTTTLREELDSSGVPTGIARLRLEDAAAGLTYTSESDYPFTWWFHAGPVTRPLTPDAFRATLGLAGTVRVETRDLDEFFARHIEWVDPYDATAIALVPRYERLRETVREVLRDPVVFRVGRIAIDCYIVGFDRAGNLVGLRTVAIET